jgi:hypothetical protein
MPLLASRPFRCEDCISRFVSWMWRTPESFSPQADQRSLVYRSATAALHSGVYRAHRWRWRRRTVKAITAVIGTHAPHAVKSWLDEPVSAPVPRAKSPAIAVARTPTQPREAPATEGFPEVLGVILEMKN